MKKKQRQHDPCLITFEGIDGCGKTTQAMLAFRFLSGKGMKVKLLREPGSTKISEI
jgi:dTMP kinase